MTRPGQERLRPSPVSDKATLSLLLETFYRRQDMARPATAGPPPPPQEAASQGRRGPAPGPLERLRRLLRRRRRRCRRRRRRRRRHFPRARSSDTERAQGAESEIEPAFGSGSRGGIDTRSSLSVSSSFLPWPAVPDSWVPTEDAARCCLGRGCGVGSATAVAVVGGRPSAEVWRTSPGVEPITGFGCLVCDHHRVCGCT